MEGDGRDTPLGRESLGMSASKDTLIRRSLRRLTLGSGPLKRGSDRLQAIGRFLVLLSLFAAPVLAVAAATATAAHLRSVADAEAAERSSTSAVLLEDAEPAQGYIGGQGDGSPQRVQVRAAWTGPDGSSRDGIVLAPPGTPLGTEVPVWVDREGDLTRAPRDHADVMGAAYVVGAISLFGVPLVTWTLYAVLCAALDARRERLWETEWTAVEPDWNSRLL
jgi:hypothetical protein